MFLRNIWTEVHLDVKTFNCFNAVYDLYVRDMSYECFAWSTEHLTVINRCDVYYITAGMH
jgi:hypothetical protein